MYLTLLENLIEIVVEIGAKGYYFCLYFNEIGLFSIDASYRETAILLLGIAVFSHLRRNL